MADKVIKEDKVTKFWDMVDAETKAEAENFIERIKSKKIVKRVIPNMFVK